MTKSASGDEIKCSTEIKETISTDMTVVTTAQSKVVAITGLSIKLTLSKKESIVPLSLSLHFSSLPHPTLQREKSVVVFLFGLPAIAKPDKILKY